MGPDLVAVGFLNPFVNKMAEACFKILETFILCSQKTFSRMVMQVYNPDLQKAAMRGSMASLEYKRPCLKTKQKRKTIIINNKNTLRERENALSVDLFWFVVLSQ